MADVKQLPPASQAVFPMAVRSNPSFDDIPIILDETNDKNIEPNRSDVKHDSSLAKYEEKVPVAIRSLGSSQFDPSRYDTVVALAKKCGWGNCYYDVLPKAIAQHKIQTLVEVGIGYGGHAEHLMRTTNLPHYIGVDPHLFELDPNDAFSKDVGMTGGKVPQDQFDLLHEWIENVRLKPYEDRVELIRKPSIVAANQFMRTVDCVFIDADHRYDAVLQDLRAWYPKIKSKGGILCGDDYWMDSVKKAVHEFVQERKLTLHFWNSSTQYKIWYVVKQ